MENGIVKYQPSNGSEGSDFMERYCMYCKLMSPDPDDPRQCTIVLLTMCLDIRDEDYPEEWIYNDKDVPVCTKWDKWNWETQGDPKDIEEIIISKNQTKLF